MKSSALELPSVLAYGATERKATAKAETLALRVVAEKPSKVDNL